MKIREELHIGNIIKETLKKKKLSMAWLARQVNYEERNFCKKLKNNVISKELLHFISEVSQIDFFIYYSDDLRERWRKETQKVEKIDT